MHYFKPPNTCFVVATAKQKVAAKQSPHLLAKLVFAANLLSSFVRLTGNSNKCCATTQLPSHISLILHTGCKLRNTTCNLQWSNLKQFRFCCRCCCLHFRCLRVSSLFVCLVSIAINLNYRFIQIDSLIHFFAYLICVVR